MDLQSQESATRILTARHISAEKTAFPQDIDQAINSTLLCHNFSLQPDFWTYVEALQNYIWPLWITGMILLLATCILFAITIKTALKHWRENATSLATVLAVYPLVAASCFIVIIVPRARILSEAFAQQAVMVAMYHLFCLIIAEGGGVNKFVSRSETEGSVLETRVLPCCCWPCCVIPRPKFDTRSLSWVKYLVLQLPVIQALLYVIILVLWAEDMTLYIQSFIYIQPLVAISILSGVWGIIMCVRAAEAVGLAPRPRFLVLQLALLIVKLQCGCAKLLPEVVALPCVLPLNPSVFVNMFQNSLMMLEMLVLSLWAWRLYQVPPGKAGKMQIAVAVLEDGASGDKIAKGGVKNNIIT